ncbi:MAG: PAS domain S-box protein [Candidatus Odinarchaeota archaeon]
MKTKSLTPVINVIHFDDDEVFLDLVKFYFEEEYENINVDIATNPEKFLSILEEKDYDVIVSDYQMPEIDGLEFLASLRKKGNDTPFIMLTGRGREDVAVRALNLGAVYYLLKTGDPEVVFSELKLYITRAAEKKRLEQALRDSEDKFGNLFRHSNDPIIIHNLDGKILDFNQKALDLFGYYESEMFLANIADLHPSSMLETSKNAFKTVFQEGVIRFEIEFKKKDGSVFTAEVSSSLFDMHEKKVIQGIIRDITKQKQAMERLKESEERFRRMADNISEGLTIIEKNKIVYVNDRMSEITGYSNDELLRKTSTSLAAPEEQERLQGLIKQWRKTNSSPDELIFWIICKDGSRRCIRNRYSFRRSGNNISGHYIITTDITESKLAEIELRENEARYRNLFEESPVALYEEDFSEIKVFIDSLKQSGITDFREYFDKHPEAVKYCASLGKVLDANKTALKTVKAPSKSELLGKLNKTFSEGSLRAFKEELIALSEGKTRFTHDAVSQTLKGENIYYNLIVSVLPGYEETLSKVFVSTLDITDLKRAEEELLQSEERYRTLVTTMSEGIWVTDRNDKTSYVNPALEKMLGYKEEELLGKSVTGFLSPDSLAIFSARTRERYLNGIPSSTYELTFIRKDGTQMIARVAGTALYNGNEIIGSFGVLSDITKQKESENELRLFKSIIETSKEAISISNSEGRLIYINPAHEKLFGRPYEEAMKLTYKDYYPPESLEVVEREVLPVIKSGESWEGVLEVHNINDRHFLLWERVDSILDPDTGKIIYLFGLMHDVTEENKYQLMVQQQKEEQELFLDIITHDLRNFQFISKSYLDLISRKELPDDIVKLVNKSRRGVVLSSTLLNNISILMRRQLSFSYRLQFIDLEIAIENVKKTLVDLFPSKNIEINKKMAPGSKIIADILFEQLLLNLLTNATKNDENAIVNIEIRYQLWEDGSSELSICDHATGIHPNKREGIFEKFAEFRKTGKGSGLGLFIVKTIVDRYNWEITIKGRDIDDYTKGTCFIIKIPIT